MCFVLLVSELCIYKLYVCGSGIQYVVYVMVFCLYV